MSPRDLKSTNWTFINENTRDNDVRRQVRVHVMREYSRKQRSKQIEKHIRDQINRSKKDESLPHGESIMYLPKLNKDDYRESNSPASGYSTSPMDSPSPATPMDTSFWDSSEIQNMNITSVPSIPSPQMAFRNFREGSVDSFPMALNDRDHGLVDFWMENMPNQNSACISRIVPPYAPLRDVLFSLAMTGPAAFQVIVLDYAALLQARSLGVKETKTSILHRARAVRMVNECMQQCLHRGQSSIPDLVAVLAMAMTEDRFGTREHSLLHARAAKHIIIELGGPSTIASHRTLELFAHWVIATTEGFGYETSPPAYPDANRLNNDVNEFMTFLDNARRLSFSQSANTPGLSRRSTLFQPGSEMYRHLCPLPEENRSQYNSNYQLYCRLGALLYINLMLWDLRSSPNACERSLTEINLQISELGFEGGCIPPSLLFWSFLHETSLFDSNRLWCVQRLISVMKQLSYERMYRISEALLSFLSFESDIQGIDYLDVFDIEALKGEAFGFEFGFDDNFDA
jgi:hypothetical protein